MITPYQDFHQRNEGQLSKPTVPTSSWRDLILTTKRHLPTYRGGLSKLGRAVFGDRATAIGDERFDSKFRVTAPDATHLPARPAQGSGARRIQRTTQPSLGPVDGVRADVLVLCY